MRNINAWGPLKGQINLTKPAGRSCRFVMVYMAFWWKPDVKGLANTVKKLHSNGSLLLSIYQIFHPFPHPLKTNLHSYEADLCLPNSSSPRYFPFQFGFTSACNYMFKDNNKNTRTRCEICSKLTIKIPELCQCRGGSSLLN